MHFKKNDDPYLGLLSYRTSPLHNGLAPCELLMSRQLRTQLPLVYVNGEASRLAMHLGEDASLEEILIKLERVYGTVESGTTLLQQFYNSRQEGEESVGAYSCRLEDILNKAIARGAVAREQGDEMLRSKLWTGLKDERIRNATRIDEALEAMAGSSWYTTLDLKSGYWQIEVDEEDIQKTAFTVGPLGFYECNRMAFGLTNAPATFQRLMEHCLADLNFKKCIVYIDDIVIYAKTFEEHLERLEAVFTRLHQFGLKLKPSKCTFFRDRVKYLGHIISENGIETDPEKIEALRTWPVPDGFDELRSFLGFSGFYRKFVQNYAKMVKPLTDLAAGMMKPKKKGNDSDSQWEWSEDCQRAFQETVAALSSPPVLMYPNFTLPFICSTDASQEGLGATLSQKQDDGTERVIAYASRALRKSERNYPAHKLEFLCLKWVVTEKFHDYLYGNTFLVRTDNNPLTYVTTTAKLDATGHRWLAAALATYNFDIVYRSGKKNRDADALSRRPYEDERVIKNDAIKAISQSLCAENHQIPKIENIFNDIEGIDDAFGLCHQIHCSAPTLSVEDLNSLQDKDRVLGKIKAYLELGRKPTRRETRNEEKEVLRVLKFWDRLYLNEGIIYKRSKTGPQGEDVLLLLVPEALKEKALTGIHDEVGHFSTERTLDLARSRFFWSGMAKDVERWVKTCKACVLRKAPQPQRVAPLVSITTTEPLELVCVDYLKLERSKGGYENILVITDHFTRYAQAIPTLNQTAKTTANAIFNKFVVHYGFPARLHSDQGRNFESQTIQQLCRIARTSRTRTTPYHPMGNGMCERFNRTLLHMLGTLGKEQKANWKDFVAPVVHAYNATKHESTGVSPFYLMFGRHPRLAIDVQFGHDPNGFPRKKHSVFVDDLRKRLDYAYKLAKVKAKSSAERQKKTYDGRKPTSNKLSPGDKVLVKNVTPKGKLDNFWEDDIYIVVAKLNEEIPVYQIQREDGKGRSIDMEMKWKYRLQRA
ncbi:hypothetical protein QZH41_019605 [Actinostola sp. cb2023]|nr:hypothetical protein QZH41_019605 [Actinostola sp. cb2023]